MVRRKEVGVREAGELDNLLEIFRGGGEGLKMHTDDLRGLGKEKRRIMVYSRGEVVRAQEYFVVRSSIGNLQLRLREASVCRSQPCRSASWLFIISGEKNS